jgi:hypothetical protein
MEFRLRMQRGVGVAGSGVEPIGSVRVYVVTELKEPGNGVMVPTSKEEFYTSFLSHFLFLRSVRRLLVRTNVVPSSPILVTLMMEALSSS